MSDQPNATDSNPTVEPPIFDSRSTRIRKARHGWMAYNPHDRFIGRSIDCYGEFSELEYDLFRQILCPGFVAIEAGAQDVESDDDGSIEVLTAPEDFLAVKQALTDAGFEPDNAEVGMIPQSYNLLDEGTSEKVLRLMDNLDDLDDVQNVYTNADFPQSIGGE